MDNKLDKYNKLVDLIGDIVKVASSPDEQKNVDEALDIAHTVGNTLEIIVNKNDNTVSQYGNNNQ